MKRKVIWALVGAFVLIAVAAPAVLATQGASHQIGRIFIGEDEASNHTGNATITPTEAKSIAENYTNGSAISVELENENGYLVYGVIIKNQTGSYDVKIDAGNGSVLKVDSNANDNVTGESGTIDKDNYNSEHNYEYKNEK